MHLKNKIRSIWAKTYLVFYGFDKKWHKTNIENDLFLLRTKLFPILWEDRIIIKPIYIWKMTLGYFIFLKIPHPQSLLPNLIFQACLAFCFPLSSMCFSLFQRLEIFSLLKAKYICLFRSLSFLSDIKSLSTLSICNIFPIMASILSEDTKL